MGKGQSPLQRDILAALEAHPGWRRPRDILNALGREPTPSNRVGMTKALARLCERGLIQRERGEAMNVGKSYLYRWPQEHG
jgi:predicted transcriptional regulator